MANFGGGQTIWNMDMQVNMRIDHLLNLCEEKFHKNDLEGVYWELRAVKRNMIGKNLEKEKMEKGGEKEKC